MNLPNLFSRRKRQSNATGVDVYSYNEIPQGFRVQFCQIVNEAFGPYFDDGYSSMPSKACYEELVRIMRREKQVFVLPPARDIRAIDSEFFNWLLSETEIESVLDGIEITCRLIDNYVRNNFYLFQNQAKISPSDALTEINARLLEACIGYQYQSGQIIRVDSKFTHTELVVPTLTLLSGNKFRTVEQEFLLAHAAYRSRDYEDCLLQCAKAFESVLKIIGANRRWAIAENDSAAKLVGAAFNSGFIPAAMQAEFTALRSLLEAGVPVLRNKMSGHGAGNVPRNVPEHFAAFQLHQTAAVILFLVTHDQATK